MTTMIQSEPVEVPAMLTSKQVARRLAVSERSIFAWVARGLMPQPVRVGRSTRFLRRDLEAWEAAGCPKCGNA